jgi:thermostable 8-oxoguanine DNA glycosylase
MQIMYGVLDGRPQHLELPCPKSSLVPGVVWGSFDEIMTPAYWRGQAWQHLVLGTYANFRLGRTLREELAACLLGGFGMPADLGLAAYDRLREFGILDGNPRASEIEGLLSTPFRIRGRERRYRFPRQKARYLSGCLEQLKTFEEPVDDVEFRDSIAHLPGIGLKTSSWIIRNYRGSSRVAIIDVHILRAGRHIGLFPDSWRPERNYGELEDAFLRFAEALDVPASILDAMIWDYMRRLSVILPGRRRADSRQIDLFTLALPSEELAATPSSSSFVLM